MPGSSTFSGGGEGAAQALNKMEERLDALEKRIEELEAGDDSPVTFTATDADGQQTQITVSGTSQTLGEDPLFTRVTALETLLEGYTDESIEFCNPDEETKTFLTK